MGREATGGSDNENPLRVETAGESGDKGGKILLGANTTGRDRDKGMKPETVRDKGSHCALTQTHLT